ncbi:hypothetical protein [Duganella sp. Leaf126]|uniref:hypothetical protein n=1 Tax=Duganella sp. Leaf126 TaxID=1736266 RepID=UPI000AB4B3C6|nr:hypothetical protein [Duganella sp. Leaf126]
MDITPLTTKRTSNGAVFNKLPVQQAIFIALQISHLAAASADKFSDEKNFLSSRVSA